MPLKCNAAPMIFTLQSDEADERPVYLTGNFNRWDPRDAAYQMKPAGTNRYELEVDNELLPERIEYKFTRGGWENVEIDRFGNITPNRKIQKKRQKAEDHVERWRINWGPFKKEFFPICLLYTSRCV